MQAPMNRKKPKSGGFQSMDLIPNLFRAIQRKGYKQPTPIQRKCIPLVLSGKDVVGMARTGSGKTAAFLIPLINKLRQHSAKVGIRGLILSPSRELALQTQRVTGELSKYSDLRNGAIVGGNSISDQYALLATNPDIIIATPGRFLHLLVEMNLDLSTVEYVVFDEADRLFEMGFTVQLHEILNRLPATRQTLLFSATLPKTLVDFAKAGLEEPELVRLDAETKVSEELEMAFFHVTAPEKEAALLYLLREVIKLPVTTLEERRVAAQQFAQIKARPRRKGKGKGKSGSDAEEDDDDDNDEEIERVLTRQRSGGPKANIDHQTIIFVATKHHVEYLAQLLLEVGYAVAYIYGSLDQTARKIQIENFRAGRSTVLVVTDVAARGIDIPILQNVVNYHFVDNCKTFVHRVGRVARAGRRGWAYSLVTNEEIPYVLDLQLFLGRRLLVGQQGAEGGTLDYSKDIVIGRLPNELMMDDMEWVTSRVENSIIMVDQRRMATNGYKLFSRTRQAAASESHKRCKELLQSPAAQDTHSLLTAHFDDAERQRMVMVSAISQFRPAETVFEVGCRGTKNVTPATLLMRKRRDQMDKVITETRQRKAEAREEYNRKVQLGAYQSDSDDDGSNASDDDDARPVGKKARSAATQAEEEEEVDLDAAFPSRLAAPAQSYRDPEYYMSHAQSGANTERGYAVSKGGSFAEQAQKALFDVNADDQADIIRKRKALRWDAKKKNFVRGTGIGADNKKLIKSESGVLLPASYSSGSYQEWQSKHGMSIPRSGEQELRGTHIPSSSGRGGGRGGGRGRGRGGRGGATGDRGDTKGKGNNKGKPKSELRDAGQIAKLRREELKKPTRGSNKSGKRKR
ncbi:ATP-dependent RNA helicase dbp10 [Tieghemiomyces parasiticus]|uniref:RNA helicase n=1 Tax=Tieghemiomyces parasiticus TaxID=78921 RepID=A0A9W8AG43_9FUNG|nr:ATP-dependent RNA helicase dbp10 [Tieghemiomyces parasiticus]